MSRTIRNRRFPLPDGQPAIAGVRDLSCPAKVEVFADRDDDEVSVRLKRYPWIIYRINAPGPSKIDRRHAHKRIRMSARESITHGDYDMIEPYRTRFGVWD